MDAPMPLARIKPPGAIPGWKTVRPPLVVNGPNGEKITLDAGGDYVVVKHGQMMNSAWMYYTANFLPEVERTWNDAIPKIDSFTQTKKGDPELDAIAKEMGKKWNVPIQPKKGTVSAQVAGTGVDKGTTVSQIDKGVSEAGEDFKKGLQSTGAKLEGDTAGTPVQQAVTALQGARDDVKSHMQLCKDEGVILEGLVDSFEAAGHKLKVRELEATKEKEEKEKKDIESGQATLKKIDPELARTVGMFRELEEKLKLVDMAKSAAGNVEKYGEVGLMYEAAKSVMTIAKWNAVEAAEKAIAITVDQIQSSLEKESIAAFKGAEKALRGQTAKLKTMAGQAEAKFLTEKSKYEELSKVVRDKKNWKGENPEQAELAAKAIKAIPVVQKLTRFLLDVRGGLPKRLPDASFNADRAYTLAIQGTPAPGAADLLTVAGWIAGITPVIDAEIVNWNAVLTRLEMVTTDLGLV
jgi:hypothetical protein